MNLKGTYTLNTGGVDYGSTINEISKIEAITLLQNSDLSKKLDHYKI